MIKGFKYTDIQLNAHEEAYLATVEKILEVEVVPKGTSFRITLLSQQKGFYSNSPHMGETLRCTSIAKNPTDA